MTDRALEIQRLIWAFVRVNPSTPLEIARARLVHADRKMTLSEFQSALEKMKDEKIIFQSKHERLKAVARPRKLFVSEPELERKPVRLKFPKMRVHKGKVKLVRRRYIQGNKCRRCGHFINRAWDLRILRKCPVCNRQKYYGKPILVRAERVEEKLTKKGKQFYKLARESGWRIVKPTLKQLSIKPSQVVEKHEKLTDAELAINLLRMAGDDRPFRLVHAYEPKSPGIYWFIIHDPTLPRVTLPKPRGRGRPRVHLRREDYRGSQKASEAAKKAWDTRRGRVAVGFFKDEKDRTRPITKPVSELKRKKIIRKPKKFRGVQPRKTKKESVVKLPAVEVVGVNVAAEPRKWKVRRSSSSKGIEIVYEKKQRKKRA